MLEKIIFYLQTIEVLGFADGVAFLFHRKLRNNKIVNLSNIAHPILLRPGTTDELVFTQIFIDLEYDLDIGFEPKTIIDGGANIGLSSIYFKNRYKDAKIIAIEPDADNVEILKANVSKYDNIFVKQAGLWSKKTKCNVSDKYGIG